MGRQHQHEYPNRSVVWVSMVKEVTGQDENTDLVQGEERIKFHDGEVVTEQNERRHVNDILWPSPQMREELGSSCSREPDNVTREDIPVEYHVSAAVRHRLHRYVPPRQMVTALFHRFRTLPHEDDDKARANKERQRIE